MKAAVRTGYGPPETVRVEDVARPTAKDHQVLVKVYATTVNRTDCGFRSGRPFIVRFFSGVRRPRQTILGCEFAGVVEEVGPSVTSFAPGDRVFGFSEWRFGAHAEYLVMADDGSIAPMPANRTYGEVAPSTEGSHYARSLITRARIRGGQRVLVNGATGAIGSAAVQLLRRLGANVTAVCGPDQVELVRGLGADRVIDRSAEDFTKDVQTYDVVLDAVGKSSFGRCRRLLKPKGIYLSSDLGPLSLNPILALVTPLAGRKRVMFPIPPKFRQQEVLQLKEMLESGEFRPIVDRRYRLDEIVDAYAYVETGQKIGNVLIDVHPHE
jgi:NADPH:quinone reductase-like Zn-dependent oxidoreductase